MNFKILENENVIIKEDNGIHYLQFKRLLEYEEILSHAFSLGRDLNFRTAPKTGESILQTDELEKALNDYKKLCSSVGLDWINLVRPTMSHGDNVQIVTEKFYKDKPDINIKSLEKTDGLITNKRDIVLATTGSDCITMIFFDPKKKVIANVHSGWRGTLAGISQNAVKKLQANFNVSANDLMCCMAPAIRQCHFEVESDVANMFYEKYKYLHNIGEIIKIGSKSDIQKYFIDTIAINISLLKNIGLKEENIIDSKICTVCNKNLINSYRAHGKDFGLNALIVGLKR